MQNWLVFMVFLTSSVKVQEAKNASIVEEEQTTTAAAVSTATISNCTRCYVWKGDECYDYQPCTFCNQTVSCNPDYLVCRDNVCMLDGYGGKFNAMTTYLDKK